MVDSVRNELARRRKEAILIHLAEAKALLDISGVWHLAMFYEQEKNMNRLIDALNDQWYVSFTPKDGGT